MKNKAAWKYAILLAGITFTIIVVALPSLLKTDPDCLSAQGQTVVKWKDMDWPPCRYSWSGHCIWPVHRIHSTYKVTVNEGVPLRDKNGMPIPIARGKIMKWLVYDSATWNGFDASPRQRNKYPGYEPIADNEYVVTVETRYRLFHNVEDTLRLCIQKP